MAHYMRSFGYQTFLSGKCILLALTNSMGLKSVSLLMFILQILNGYLIGLPAQHLFLGTALNGVVEAGPCIRTMQEDYDDDVEFQARRKILILHAKILPAFFGVVSFTSPHTPFNVSQRYWDL